MLSCSALNSSISLGTITGAAPPVHPCQNVISTSGPVYSPSPETAGPLLPPDAAHPDIAMPTASAMPAPNARRAHGLFMRLLLFECVRGDRNWDAQNEPGRCSKFTALEFSCQGVLCSCRRHVIRRADGRTAAGR